MKLSRTGSSRDAPPAAGPERTARTLISVLSFHGRRNIMSVEQGSNTRRGVIIHDVKATYPRHITPAAARPAGLGFPRPGASGYAFPARAGAYAPRGRGLWRVGRVS